MPELPDIEVFAFNLKNRFAGKKVTKVKVVNGTNLKDSAAELSKNLEGATLENVSRSGKELRFHFSNGIVLGMHLMLTGDLIPFEGKNERKTTIVEFYFDNRTAFALTDRWKTANVKLHPEDKDGVDALSKELDYKYLKQLLNRKAKVKSVLTDQNRIRGIGNGYSDEILWKSGIHPDSVAKAIPDEKVKELATTIKKVLKEATRKILNAYPGLITGEIKEFHKVHNKNKTHSPTGFEIKINKKGMMKTYYTDEQVLYT
jgi:formamidopyrimidine-DNA glycosylase